MHACMRAAHLDLRAHVKEIGHLARVVRPELHLERVGGVHNRLPRRPLKRRDLPSLAGGQHGQRVHCEGGGMQADE